MSIIKVNQVQDTSTNVAANISGGVVTFNNPPSLSTGTMSNAPAFEAELGSDQTISNLSTTKAQFNTELFDTDNKYDNSSNYRFTPGIAGKYYVYTNIGVKVGAFEIQQLNTHIYKNGSDYRTFQGYDSGNVASRGYFAAAVMDLNATDYVEIYVTVRQGTGSGTMFISADSNVSYFGAYKLIGV